MWVDVAARFGLEGQVRPLPGERTANAVLLAPDGRPVAVLKLHLPADADEIALEMAALQHLSAFREMVGRVPRVLTTAAGDAVLVIDTPDGARLARGLSWLPGRTWRDVDPGPAAFEGLGRLVARVDAALAGFDHPHADRALRWNLARAGDALSRVDHVEDPVVRQAVRATVEEFLEDVAPVVATLPGQVIHNDANDANLVLDDTGAVHGLIDFGDLCRAPRVCGLAIACAYAVAAVPAAVDPWRGLAPVVAGYHAVAPLDAMELALLPALVRTRVAVSIAMAGWQHARDPGNAYLLSSQDAMGAALHRLSGLDDHLALTRLRAATGLEPCPRSRAVRDHLAGAAVAPVLGRPLGDVAHEIMDWSGPDPAPVEVVPDRVLIGRYREDRSVYTTDAYATPTGERRTMHLGVDLFVPAGHPLHAPLDGVVEACGDNAAPLDYGPVIILRHDLPGGGWFFTLYGHLSRTSLHGLHPGTPVPAGTVFATIGTPEENGGWAPHVHLQLFTDLVGLGLEVPGVVPRSELAMWTSLCPDPNLLLGLPEGVAAPPTAAAVVEAGHPMV